MVLEPALARLAALRASPFEIVAHPSAPRRHRAEADPGAADLAFHTAVAAGSRNVLAAEVYALAAAGRAGTAASAWQQWRRTCPNRIRQRDAEHAAIAAAIAARDPEGAERAMRDHLAAVQRQILRAPGARHRRCLTCVRR